jgi:nicotinamidase-related amidase
VLVVDVQERLLPAVRKAKTVLARTTLLARAARQLGVPLWVTEQYPRGLGPTVAGLIEALGNQPRREKLTFSALGAEGLRAELTGGSVTDVVLCGIETHVCVCQTALDLRTAGCRVFVAVDAVSSRMAADHKAGLARMRAAGVLPVSVEMVIFEWLERADTEEFKQLLPLLK